MRILLDRILTRKNLSIRQVSILTGVPRSTIEDIITGKRSPRMSTMEQLAKGLNLRITDLFESPYK